MFLEHYKGRYPFYSPIPNSTFGAIHELSCYNLNSLQELKPLVIARCSQAYSVVSVHQLKVWQVEAI